MSGEGVEDVLDQARRYGQFDRALFWDESALRCGLLLFGDELPVLVRPLVELAA